MMSRKRVMGVVLILVLPALACIPTGGETPAPETAAPATAPPTEVPPTLPPPTATPTQPMPAPTVAATRPSFSGLFFAAGVNEDGEPIDVGTQFPAGTTIVYAFASYEGMSDVAECDSVWYLDGEEVLRTPFDWELGESGGGWIANIQDEGGLPAGRYDWELYVEEGLVITGTFSVVARAAILFEDDFSDPGSGWEVGDYRGGSVGYENGIYSVISLGDGDAMWGLANRSFDDLIVEVEGTQVSAPANDNNAYGVMCRVQPNGDGYLLRISGDGYYSIMKNEAGELEGLADWARSDVIRHGNATNNIRAVCTGSDLVLFVNGELLAEASDATFSEGDIALTATSFEDEATEIHFDNLVVSSPGAGPPPPPRPEPTATPTRPAATSTPTIPPAPTSTPMPPPTPTTVPGCPPSLGCMPVTSTCGVVTLTIGNQAYTVQPEDQRTGPPVVVQLPPGEYTYTASIADPRYGDAHGTVTIVAGWNRALNFWCEPT